MTYSEDDERIRRKGEPYTDDVEARDFRGSQLRLIDHILDNPQKFTPRENAIAHLYFKCGLTQVQIACFLKAAQPSISRSMANLLRKASL